MVPAINPSQPPAVAIGLCLGRRRHWTSSSGNCPETLLPWPVGIMRPHTREHRFVERPSFIAARRTAITNLSRCADCFFWFPNSVVGPSVTPPHHPATGRRLQTILTSAEIFGGCRSNTRLELHGGVLPLARARLTTGGDLEIFRGSPSSFKGSSAEDRLGSK